VSFAKAQKRMREKARQEKAAIKRQRRLERGDDEPLDQPEADADGPAEGDVLAELAALHASFEAEEIPFEEFEERKQELLARLAV
jgi:hypothetical protein